MTEPLTAEEEARHRAYVEAACREVDVVKGGMFDMAARLLATLDAAREGQGLDVERLARAMNGALPEGTLGQPPARYAHLVAARYAALHSTNADPEPGQGDGG